MVVSQCLWPLQQSRKARRARLPAIGEDSAGEARQPRPGVTRYAPGAPAAGLGPPGGRPGRQRQGDPRAAPGARTSLGAPASPVPAPRGGRPPAPGPLTAARTRDGAAQGSGGRSSLPPLAPRTARAVGPAPGANSGPL